MHETLQFMKCLAEEHSITSVHFPYPYRRHAIFVTQTQSTAKTSLSVHVNDFVI
jgi:hypothetical protein